MGALPDAYPEIIEHYAYLRPDFVCVYDDLGVPGDLTAPAYVEALDAVLAAARRHGKACGMLVGDGTAAAARLAEGWSFLAIGSDSTLLAATIRTELGRARTPSSS